MLVVVVLGFCCCFVFVCYCFALLCFCGGFVAVFWFRVFVVFLPSFLFCLFMRHKRETTLFVLQYQSALTD